ncbi:MAG: hypothetical protein HRU50_00900 [Winogradskyella sp.]|uniref:hypothetical protein n=1 Tax=Winogradskyella sp. TaxID=1883156 RepID=UPI0025FE443C|nr:hypothetical protein [Winogradskyella sp.]NRB58480.1 hypothetical protein [Winogradskyella sp.]
MKTKSLFYSLLFLSIFATAQNNTCACCTEKHSEFDFWIGTWEVTNPNGTKAGHNVLIKVEDNCVLRENWTSATPGYTGTSNSFYNSKTNQWEQVWVDNQGQSLHLKGNKVGNQMILRTDDEKNAGGKIFYHQVTWTDNADGTVRQKWETFTEGQDVVVAFDGLYKPKD